MSKQVPRLPPSTGFFGYFTQPAVVSLVGGSWLVSKSRDGKKQKTKNVFHCAESPFKIVETPGEVGTFRVPSWGNPMIPIDWDIRREGRQWSQEEFDQRLYQAQERIEFVNGIFAGDRERFNYH